MACKHKHGDKVPALMGWVCGQCFAVLSERPKRYGMRSIGLGTKHDLGSRQEIVWQAEIRKSAEGTTLSVFLAAAARRFEKRGLLSKSDAYEQALSAIKGMGVEFGNPDWDWSRASAIDIADEEMSYWDECEAAGNG